MKKFFKSLALVLALTLVFGCISVSAAETTSYKLKQASKIIYVGGSQGTNGAVKSAIKSYYNVKVEGRQKGEKIVTTTSNDKIASVDGKKVSAVGIGTATVSVSIKQKNGTVVPVGDLKVTVKKNADSVSVKGLENGQEVELNKEYDVVLSRKGTDTDERSLTTDATEGVEIKATNDYNTTYTVKFTKAGEYTLTAAAFQNAKLYPDVLKSTEIKVKTAGLAAKTVAQTALNAFDIEFTSEAKDVDAKDIKIYTKANDIKTTFSMIEKISADKNVATVKMFSKFVAGTTYYVTYADGEEMSFVAAGDTKDDIASIKVLTEKATAGATTPIKWALYNAAGIDITDSAKAGVTVYTEMVGTNYDAYVSGGNVVIYEAGKTATVKAYIKYYDAKNDYKEVVISSEDTVITGVAAATTTYVGVKKVAVTLDDTAIKADKDYATSFRMNDAGAELQMMFEFNDGTKTPVYAGLNDIIPGTVGDTYQVRSNNNDVVMLGTAAANGIRLIPVKEGKAQIVIETVHDGKATFLTVVEVEVKEARKVVSFEAYFDKNLLNIAGGDEVTLKIKMKDQDGNYCAPDSAPVVKYVAAMDEFLTSKASLALPAPSENGGRYDLVLAGSAFAIKNDDPSNRKEVNVVLTVEEKTTKQTQTVRFNVKNAGTDADNYEVVIDEKDAIDTAVVKSSKLSAYKTKITLDGTKGGYTTGSENISVIADIDTLRAATGAAATSYKYQVEKDGKVIDITSADYNKFITANADNIAISAIDASGLKIKKMPKGVYTVRFFKCVQGATGTQVVPFKSANVTITDSQKALAITQTKEAYGASTSDGAKLAIFNTCFKVKFEDETILATAVDAVTNAAQDYMNFTKVTAEVALTGSGLAGKVLELSTPVAYHVVK